MGKGDKKTKRGKIIMGTHGVRRLRKRKGLVTTTPERKVGDNKKADKPKEADKKKSPKVEEKTPPKIESVKADALPAEEKKDEAVETKVVEKPKKGKKAEASSEEEPAKGEK